MISWHPQTEVPTAEQVPDSDRCMDPGSYQLGDLNPNEALNCIDQNLRFSLDKIRQNIEIHGLGTWLAQNLAYNE